MKGEKLDYGRLKACAQAEDYAGALALLQGNKDGAAFYFIALIKLWQKDQQGYVRYLELASKGKCLKANGYLLDAYRAIDERKEKGFVKKHRKDKDGITLYLCGNHFAKAKAYEKALKLFTEAKALAAAEMEDTSPFAACYMELCPFAQYFPKNVYARICHEMMFVLEKIGNVADRKTFIACWKDAVTHYSGDEDKLVVTMSYLLNVVDNTMGLADYRNSVEAFPLMEELYAAVDEETQARYQGTYELICRLHAEFIEKERERLGRQNIVYSEGLAKENALSFGNVMHALAEGAKNWASSTSQSTSKQTYIIDGREYELGTDGYLYRDGLKSSYSIRDGNRLHVDGGGYNEHSEIGYFNNHGNFISNG